MARQDDSSTFIYMLVNRLSLQEIVSFVEEYEFESDSNLDPDLIGLYIAVIHCRQIFT